MEPEVKERIKLTGNISNVEEFLTTMSVGFLFSTQEYSEGISNSILEYMASGIVPIVSDIGASNEIVEDGLNGFLVNKNNLEEIANIIKRLRSDREYSEGIISNARMTIDKQFSTNSTIKKLETIYKEISV